MEVQTRSWQGEIKLFSTVAKAFAYAEENKEVWKVSFDLSDGNRARFIRDDPASSWKFDDLMQSVIEAAIQKGMTELAAELTASNDQRNNEAQEIIQEIVSHRDNLYEGGNTIPRHPGSYFE